MIDFFIDNKKMLKGQDNDRQFMSNWTNILNVVTDMITIHDNNYNIIFANSVAVKELKVPSNGKKKLKCYKYYHGLNRPPKNCPSCQMLKSGELASEERFETHLNRNLEIRAFPRTNRENDIIGSIHIVRDITQRKQREEQIENSREKLQNLTAHLQYVREVERKRIAREIHDELGHELAILNMEVLKLEKIIPRGEKQSLEMLGSVSNRIERAITMVQKIVSELRPALVDKFGLRAAIEWQAEEFQTRTGIKCNVSVESEITSLDKDREIYIFRIVQEVFTNIMRHADASRVGVVMKEGSGRLRIVVDDNGKGISDSQIMDPNSFGIIGMNERASFLGGSLSINGRPDAGTTVKLYIPVLIESQESDRLKLKN